MPGETQATQIELVGRRRVLPALKGRGGAAGTAGAIRSPGARRCCWRRPTIRATLAAERRIVDWRPILWLVALLVLAIAPPLLGNNSFILRRHQLRDVLRDQRDLDADRSAPPASSRWPVSRPSASGRMAAHPCRSISAFRGGRCSSPGRCSGWSSASSSPLPAIRLEGFYYALLTVGIAELCRAYVTQSQALGVRQRPARRGQLRAELACPIAAA